jgi:hypothetical protein
VLEENYGLPCFLFGHSTGGAIVLKVCWHNRPLELIWLVSWLLHAWPRAWDLPEGCLVGNVEEKLVVWRGWPGSLISLDQTTNFQFLGLAWHLVIANPTPLDKSSNPTLSFSHIQTPAAALFIAPPSPCAYDQCGETSLPDGRWLLCPPPQLIVALSAMGSCSPASDKPTSPQSMQASISSSIYFSSPWSYLLDYLLAV